MTVPREKGFALLSVLVILAAIALISVAIVERASLLVRIGAFSFAGEQRTLRLQKAVRSVASGNLREGVAGECIEGTCGRMPDGNQRSWTSGQVVQAGVAAGTLGGQCPPYVAVEFLGASASGRFWRIVATCLDSEGGANGFVSAFVAMDLDGRRSLEWTAR